MKLSLITLFALVFLSATVACNRHEVSKDGVSQPAPNAEKSGNASGAVSENGAAPVQKADACALLTSAEIESVQSEPVKTTKLSASQSSGFSVSQCFFTLPTFANSISLQVTQKGGSSDTRDPREFWRTTFHTEGATRDERERERERAREQVTKHEEVEEQSAPPKKIEGIGDEAFWMSNPVGGALYVLRGNSYLRISVGGAGDQNSKIKKSSVLAQKALSRLNS